MKLRNTGKQIGLEGMIQPEIHLDGHTEKVSRLARITTRGVNHLQATGKIRIEGEILERMGTKNKGGVLQKEDLQNHLLVGHNKRGVQGGLRDHLSG